MILFSFLAKVLQELPTHERTAWALASKKAANELFRRGDFKMATDMYMEVSTRFCCMVNNLNVIFYYQI
jgi:hypothetical protein